MNAPGFWSNPPDQPGWQARLLAPLSLVWRLGATVRATRANPEKIVVPVVCVGNLTAGGAGKSPMVAALMRRLSEQGANVHVVSRGYGGRFSGPHRVDPARDSHRDVGDEPLMLAALGPVWIASDRAAGARAAAAAGAEIVLLDDGYQNPGIVKDASILMVDAGQGFGNCRLIPAGPLREPVAGGLARADLTVLVGPAETRTSALSRWPELAAAGPIGAELVAQPTGLPLDGEDVIAFAGIARPEKFFETLRAMGAHLLASHAFPDHHDFPPAILRRLITDSRQAGAVLVTTEKDAVRLPSELRNEILTVQVRLEPVDWTALDALLRRFGTESP